MRAESGSTNVGNVMTGLSIWAHARKQRGLCLLLHCVQSAGTTTPSLAEIRQLALADFSRLHGVDAFHLPSLEFLGEAANQRRAGNLALNAVGPQIFT